MLKQKYFLLTALAVAMIGATAASAHAGTITLNNCVTPATCGSLTGSVTVTITNDTLNEAPGTNDVKIVITNGTNGFIDELGLFYTGGFPVGAFIEQISSNPAGLGTTNLTSGKCQNDNTALNLNLCLDFPPPGTVFAAGEVVTLFLDSLTTDLSQASFSGDAYAHVQSLGTTGNSVKITNGTITAVPEPASMLLLGSGLSGLAAAVRRRKKQIV